LSTSPAGSTSPLQSLDELSRKETECKHAGAEPRVRPHLSEKTFNEGLNATALTSFKRGMGEPAEIDLKGWIN